MTETISAPDTPTAEDMPGRQRQIQDCVDQILAKVEQAPAAG